MKTVGIVGYSVLRLVNVDSRRRPFRILTIEEAFGLEESIEAGAESIDAVVELDALVGDKCCWLELHDVACVDSEFRPGSSKELDAVEDIARADMSSLMIAKVVVGSWGIVIPRLSAVTRNC